MAESYGTCLTFPDRTAKQLCRMVAPFYTPTSSLRLVPFHPCQHLVCKPSICAILLSVWWDLIMVPVCISPMTHDVEHLSMSLFAIHISSLVKCVVQIFCPFLNWSFKFSIINFKSSLYILDTIYLGIFKFLMVMYSNVTLISISDFSLFVHQSIMNFYIDFVSCTLQNPLTNSSVFCFVNTIGFST